MNNEGSSPVSMDDVAHYFNVPAAPSALTNAEMIAALTEVYSWARDLPIPTPGTISAMQKVRTVRDALAAAPVAAQTQVLVAIRAALGDQYDPAAGEAMSLLRVMNGWKAEAELGEKYKQMALSAAQAGQVAVPEGGLLLALKTIRAMAYSAPQTAQWIAEAVHIADEALAASPSAPAVAQQAPAQAEPIPAEPIECWSHNEEDFNARSLGELIDDHELQPGVTVWVGEAVHPEPGSLFNTDWLIESMGEAAYDIGGEHAGEDYPNVSDEQVAELEALIVGWIAKCAPPNFWTVKNVRAYVLTAEDCGAQASTPDGRQEGGAV